TRATDEECRAAVARLPTVLQLLHREIGNVGHYDLLGTKAVSPQPFARTPWVRRWAEGGSEAMWEALETKWHSVWRSDLWRRLKDKRAELKETPDQAWVEAAQGLYKKLQKGVCIVRRNVCKPINYDARKLWYAKDLTLPEQELLREVRRTEQTMPGTVEVRRHVGRFLFGARVELGEPLFLTLSPTAWRNGLCLKFSRYRRADPEQQGMGFHVMGGVLGLAHAMCPEKDALRLWPCFLLQDTQPSAWTQDQAEQAAATDAARFKAAYDAAVQQKLTHQQHHVHPWSASQQTRLPLPARRKKNAPNKCKHGFPRPPNPRCTVICRGNARKFKLSTRGRCNALGTVLGRRQDPWLSGTCRALALMLMGNSHTRLNYRVPLASSTHDPDCGRDFLAQTVRRLQRAIAQAARRATKFYGGQASAPADGWKFGQSATSWPRPNARLTKQCAEVDTTWVDVATVRRLSEGGGFQYSNRTAPAVRNIVQQWRTNANAEQVADLARCAGVPDPNKALGAGAGDAPQERPSEARPQPAVACVYSKLSAQAAAQWLRNLHDPSTLARPSAEQQAFLQAVIDRCLREAREEAEDKPFRSEPLRAFLHGVPGAGKSQTLKWLRGFFEEICGWMQGQEFVYLASQNTQAALIDGNTLHSFAELQVKAPKQSRQTQFGPDKFVKYQRLRWLIVDECSTVALEVFAVLQLRLAEATRKKRSWKCRDTTRAAVRRRELPLRRGLLAVPRGARHLAVPKPFQQGVSVQVANLHRLFWTHGEDGVQRLVELTKEHRCVDPWLSHVLLQARYGRLSQEVWCFLHGYPTLHAGSWCPNSGQRDCQQDRCNGCCGGAGDYRNQSRPAKHADMSLDTSQRCHLETATEPPRRGRVHPASAAALEGRCGRQCHRSAKRLPSGL
ncbi:unnamed protein product, partial [Effrenium voratum]